jgi:hypothetical protein
LKQLVDAFRVNPRSTRTRNAGRRLEAAARRERRPGQLIGETHGGAAQIGAAANNGVVHRERPWELYEFDDPALQAHSSGQKLLLRMGPLAGQRMRAKLAEFREIVTLEAVPR